MLKIGKISEQYELFMMLAATGILMILFVPIPAYLLDLLFIINFSWALTILLLTFYTDKPLSFSTFPALLLMSTLFRLALNISATRLILSSGDAGRVIAAIGQYVIHDNYVMGLVVFMILIIVQYVVVTNGAQRVAEVAARFTLDSMPGKQMSIDADLNMGLISPDTARFKRSQIEKEANFYGAMDGASKFVKGDAIAGILIVLVDIIGGFAIGMTQKGLSFAESIQTYSLLTIGDGLITQIPALTISMATGIIVTRAATDAHLGREVAKQITSYPHSLFVVCACLTGLLFLKGIPTIPVFLILILFAAIALLAQRAKNQHHIQEDKQTSLYERIRVNPVEIRLNPDLYTLIKAQEAEFLVNIEHIREQLAFELGFVIPSVTLRVDKKLPQHGYSICIHGTAEGSHELYPNKLLALAPQRQFSFDSIALEGVIISEPHLGRPAIWIEPAIEVLASDAGLSLQTPLTALTLHVKHVIQLNLHTLLTRHETELLLEQPSLTSLRDELIPALLSIGQVQRILQLLLQENVAILNLAIILEVLIEHSKHIPEAFKSDMPGLLVEYVRGHLSTSICQALIDNKDNPFQVNRLNVLMLAPSLENTLNQHLSPAGLALAPSITERFVLTLANHIEKMVNERKKPILLCATPLRRQIKQLTGRVLPHLTVLGMNEVPIHIQVESFSIVT